MAKAGKGQGCLRGALRGSMLVLALFASDLEPHNLTFTVKMSSKQTSAKSKRDCSFPVINLSEFLETVDIDVNKLNK